MGWPGPVTFRQYLGWLYWSGDEMNRPGRIEHYIMRVAQEVARNDKGVAPDLEVFKVPFKVRGRVEPKMTREQAAKVAKDKAVARVGGKVKVIQISKAEAEANLRGL